jgi:putative redox protein
MASIQTGKVSLLEGLAFQAHSGTGHTFMLDASEDVGGVNRGARPTEVVLLALGACTGMDVVSILRKKRQDITGYDVQLAGQKVEGHPAIFTEITIEHIVRGRNVVPEAVRRSIELSATKYCAVAAMLERSARLTHHYRVIDEATGKETTGTLNFDTSA